jgi:hypothetical protein
MVRRIAALLLVLGLSGCGLIGKSSQAKSPDGPASGPPAAGSNGDGGRTAKSPVPDIAAAVANSSDVSFMAEYKIVRSDGKVEPWTVVLIHQAPVIAVIRQAPDATISEIWSPTDTYTCYVGGEAGKGKCEHKGPSDAFPTDREDWAAPLKDDTNGVGRALDPANVLSDVESFIWNAKPEVIRTTGSYGGQNASCVKTVATGDVSKIRLEDEACFTSHGIIALTKFTHSMKDQGYGIAVELIKYSEKVDPAKLKPPAGAEIIEG